MTLDGARPLAVQVRGDFTESVHLGHLVLVAPDGRVLLERGDASTRVFARSALKPVQALPLLLGGAADAYGLSGEAIALTLASHSGEPIHREAVAELLKRAGLHHSQLQCGTHAPYHEPTARELTLAGTAPDVLHCNCSGKHAGMLAVCRYHHWDPATYRSPDHPVQRWIRDLLAELSGTDDLTHAVDGCGVPVWRLPLAALARTFARLANPDSLPEGQRPAARKIAALMAAHPRLIAGEGRLDTDLLAASNGALISKIGGEAVHVGGVVDGGIGWAMKVVDGNRRAIAPALSRALAELGHPLPDDEALNRHVAPIVKNNRGDHVGRLEAAW